mmetsp:Transcript_63620/g.176426  ORF Transcript_63620/g.176426 Transcript_63620/m.176426 type:complete len:274 (-) Transcript_63620:846-1667(-)
MRRACSMLMHRWPKLSLNTAGKPAVARDLDTGPFRLAMINRWWRAQRVSARTWSVSQPVRSTWLMDFASMTTNLISSPCSSRTLTALRQNSFSLRAFAKLSLASMRMKTANFTISALGKLRMSRKEPSGSFPHTTRLGFPKSYMVLSTESTKPTSNPSFTERARDTAKVQNITQNSARFALKATLKWCMSTTPMAPWMIMGARAASGSRATTGSRKSTARSTSTEEMAQATSEVAPKEAFTAVLEKEPVVGYPDIMAPPMLERPSATSSWLGS